MSRSKSATKAGPSPESQITRKRNVRGFVSLEVSSRKHRRAHKRLDSARTVYGRLLEPGEKVTNGQGSFMHTAGGALHYY